MQNKKHNSVAFYKKLVAKRPQEGLLASDNSIIVERGGKVGAKKLTSLIISPLLCEIKINKIIMDSIAIEYVKKKA